MSHPLSIIITMERLGADLVRVDGEFYVRLQLRAKVVDVVEFNGHLYVLYENREYYSPIGRKANTRGALHREIWKAANGPIPEGHDIHHIDGNPLNNVLDNLTCVSRAEHRRLHGQTWPSERRMLEHLESVRPLATEWHRSDEGREWHREHGARTWEGREARTVICAECGQPFQSRYAGTVGLCSTPCRNAVSLRNPAYYVERICVECDEPFTTWKYGKQKYCGRSCANSVRARNYHAQRRAAAAEQAAS